MQVIAPRGRSLTCPTAVRRRWSARRSCRPRRDRRSRTASRTSPRPARRGRAPATRRLRDPSSSVRRCVRLWSLCVDVGDAELDVARCRHRAGPGVSTSAPSSTSSTVSAAPAAELTHRPCRGPGSASAITSAPIATGTRSNPIRSDLRRPCCSTVGMRVGREQGQRSRRARTGTYDPGAGGRVGRTIVT